MGLGLPKLAGHRGAAAHAPENTIAGLAAAKALGLSYVEFDVMLSADGVLHLMHDETLARTAGDPRRLADLTTERLKKIEAGRYFSMAFEGEPIPTFLETMEALSRFGLGANVEIKPAEGADRETAIETVRMIKAHWPSNIAPPLVSSFSLDALKAAHAADANLLLGYLCDDLPKDWLQTVRSLNCVSVHPWTDPLQRHEVEAIKREGYDIVVYTVNDRRRALDLWSWGVDCIITDDPLVIGQP